MNDKQNIDKHPSRASDLFDHLLETNKRNIDNQTSKSKELSSQSLNDNGHHLYQKANTKANEPELEIDANTNSNGLQETGTLAPEARRALVSLLRHGLVLASQKAKIFDLICRYQSPLKSHLADMYLRLSLDKKAGIAFVIQQLNDDDDERVSLISRRTLSVYDTLLLLVLRKHYQERESSGMQRIIIDIERIEANLTPFLPLTNNSKSDKRKLSSALKKMTEKRILTSVRGDDDRFEITPIIRYVVNAAFLENMLEEYKNLAMDVGLKANAEDPIGNQVND